MKKIPFPKNSRNISCYLLPDGLGFTFDVHVDVGSSVTKVRAVGLIRTGKNMLGDSQTLWVFDVSNGDGSCLDVNEVLKITRVEFYGKCYLEDCSFSKLFGNRGQSIHVYFPKGHRLNGLTFGNYRDFGELSPASPRCSGEEFLSRGDHVAFDLTIQDLETKK